MSRKTDLVNIHILFEHMDDIGERALFRFVDRIKRLENGQNQVRVFKLHSETSKYLFPDYDIRITCNEETAKILTQYIFDYSNEFFTQTGLRIILEKNGRMCPLSTARTS